MQLLTTCVAKCLTCIKYLWVGLLLRSLGAIFWPRTCWTGCHLSGEPWYQNFAVDLIKLAAALLFAESWKRIDVLLSVWLGSNCNCITSCITYRIKTSWWLNQPIWKICSSNWIMKPQGSGLKMFRDPGWKCLSCHQLEDFDYKTHVILGHVHWWRFTLRRRFGPWLSDILQICYTPWGSEWFKNIFEMC